MHTKENIRNIAIIAHVDHGKTTLVDAMLKQSGTFRENEKVAERVMDSNDLERERGITILAKNTSLCYEDIKINIVDTPGHADFGGEVERSLKMSDGVLLLIDAFEGCMPQTRFVLKKALALDLKVIMVINKADRPGARPYEVVDEVLELFLDLDATDGQLDSPIIFTSGRDGWAALSPEQPGADLTPLYELIKSYIPWPAGDETAPFQMLVSNIDYDEYTGRIAIGKVERGTVRVNNPVSICRQNGDITAAKLSKLYVHTGLKRESVQEAAVGEIIAVSGITDINIGETICAQDAPEALPFVEIDEPVLSMTFSVNNSPFAGKEGKFLTSRHIRDRLFRELESNISLRVEETDGTDAWVVSGRGELHLSVLIENLRREGYEFQVSKPRVITKTVNGEVYEPIEYLTIDIPDGYTGVVIEGIGSRKGEMVNMAPAAQGYTRVEFKVPARGLIGFRNQLMTDTKGTAVMNHAFDCFAPHKGEITSRLRGSLVAFEAGTSVAYGLFNAQDRGSLFIGVGVQVYAGMIVGENAKSEDMAVNVCKKKQLTNMRASGADETLKLTPPRNLSLEQCLDFIAEDELVEVTPVNLRLRKRILDATLRARDKKNG
ncbi:MAG: translational GTPase TypA [Oscillospiraceae bacterium]|nr:translational GTPase TypA [Oscillospiraceae bacterium]